MAHLYYFTGLYTLSISLWSYLRIYGFKFPTSLKKYITIIKAGK